jgi:predicted nuclease with TOPRIM domain
MENLPKWLNVVIFLLGSGGIVWTIWSQFGDAIRSAVRLRTDIRKDNLGIEKEKMDVFQEYKKVLNDDFLELLEKYKSLKAEINVKQNELEEQVKELAENNSKLKAQVALDRAIMQKQKRWILNATKLFNKHNIDFTPYSDD